MKKKADIDGIFSWFENLENLDFVILSLDTIAYGGLIPSRHAAKKDPVKALLHQ